MKGGLSGELEVKSEHSRYMAYFGGNPRNRTWIIKKRWETNFSKDGKGRL